MLMVSNQCEAKQKNVEAWMDEAILYGITPTLISDNEGKKLQDIESHLPEIKKLGANTIWLMPIYQSDEGEEGYDVTDYFKLLPELGTEKDLQSMIDKAHDLDMKVLFDFVPNHLSMNHPYVLDVAAKGKASPYYDMFMTRMDQTPYSQFYQWSKIGVVDFVVYFWTHLINLNYDNEFARKHMRDAALYWVNKFGIDGYRFDAAWGPVARNPQFMIELRDALKEAKPGLMILAEDKASQPTHYEGLSLPYSAQLFDAVYDWTPSADHVSEWSWSQDEHSVFKLSAEEDVAGRFRTVLKKNGDPKTLKARVLRYLENNDGERFIGEHTLQETKLAAALTFTLPGIPLIFYGQEIGFGSIPTEQEQRYPTFDAKKTIRSLDRHNLWPYYQSLAKLRSKNLELSKGSYSELEIYPESAGNQILAFERRYKDDTMLVIANLDESPISFSLSGYPHANYLEGNEIKFLKNGLRLKITEWLNP